MRYEDEKLRDKSRVFADRRDAGARLAEMLADKYAGAKDAMVLGIPSGGVPVALEISRALDLPAELIIVRKVKIPYNPEAGFGSVSSTGEIFFNRELLARLGLPQEEVDRQVDRVKLELAERERRFRGGRPFPDLSGKTAVLADDGLASGYTMLAAVDSVKKRGARRVAVAVPTASQSSIRKVEPVADEVYCANLRTGPRFAVAEAYRNWRDLEPREVEAMLREAGFAA